MGPIDKQRLRRVLVERLTLELERTKAQALDAVEGATHEDARAEGDKDMRSTEAAYIARGHAQRTASLEQAVARLSHLEMPALSNADVVQLAALVEVEYQQRRLLCFVVPVAGGERIELEGRTVQALSPATPLGSALLGLQVGEEAEVESPQGTRTYTVVSVA